MKYTDVDMKWMAIGEIGAHLMAVMASVAVCLYSSWSILPTALVSFVAAVVVFNLALGFVHIGYDESDKDGQ